MFGAIVDQGLWDHMLSKAKYDQIQVYIIDVFVLPHTKC